MIGIPGAMRIITWHDTMLFVDTASGELRHGLLLTSPMNTALVREEDQARMTFAGLDGETDIEFLPECSRLFGSKSFNKGSSAPTALSFIPLPRREFGLESRGLFVSAEPDGRITLSRSHCFAWERFRARLDYEIAKDRETLKYLQNIDQVEGWLRVSTARVIHHLLRYQNEINLQGDLLEIGVHHGRLFLLLALSATESERAVAIDIFSNQDANISKSGCGELAIFERNIRTHAPKASISILQANSMELGQEFVRSHYGMRFISIDGGHTREECCNDLQLAERMLLEGGIVALDDVYRLDWSGVTAGLHKYYSLGGNLIPFALIPNKVLLASGHLYGRDYQALLKDKFPSMLYHVPMHQKQQFFNFDDVMLLTE
jgi:hypothetical protein